MERPALRETLVDIENQNVEILIRKSNSDKHYNTMKSVYNHNLMKRERERVVCEKS